MRTNWQKVQISQEILSGGPGYRITSRHGAYISCVATSMEFKPPGYLADCWRKVVNEEGNTVGLKVYIRTGAFPNNRPFRRPTIWRSLRQGIRRLHWRLMHWRALRRNHSRFLMLAEPPYEE